MGMKTLELSASLMICLQIVIVKKNSVAYCSMQMKMFFVLKTVSAVQQTSVPQPVSAAQQASAVAQTVAQTAV